MVYLHLGMAYQNKLIKTSHMRPLYFAETNWKALKDEKD